MVGERGGHNHFLYYCQMDALSYQMATKLDEHIEEQTGGTYICDQETVRTF
jgi:hypothetical protein